MENEILHLAASCLNIELTEKIGSLLPVDFSKSDDFYNFGPLSVQPNEEIEYSCPSHSITEETKKLKSMQVVNSNVIMSSWGTFLFNFNVKIKLNTLVKI